MTTTLLVQTDRILHNIELLQKHMDGAGVIPDLSANACGLGDVAVGQMLARAGCRLFAVSRLEEAERLLNAIAGIQVLLLTPYSSEAEAVRIVQRDIIATVGSNEAAVLLSGVAGRMGKKARCHVRFDLGNGTSGYLPADAAKAAKALKFLPNLSIDGVYGILTGEEKEKQARMQYETFQKALQALGREKIRYGMTHIASALAGLKFPWARMDAVRMGVSLTGRLPVRDKWGLKKVGRVVTEIVDIRWLPKGSRIPGGKIHRATRAATLPVGYADGLFIEGGRWISKRKRYCEFQGRRLQVLGRPGYTSTMVDVTDVPCNAGDQISFEVRPYAVHSGMRREYV